MTYVYLLCDELRALVHLNVGVKFRIHSLNLHTSRDVIYYAPGTQADMSPIDRPSLLCTPHLAVPWLRRLITGLPPRSPGFDPESVQVGFVVEEVAVKQVFPPSTSVFPLSV